MFDRTILEVKREFDLVAWGVGESRNHDLRGGFPARTATDRSLEVRQTQT